MYDEAESKKLQDKIFDVRNENPKSGAWWWWFWLFFWKNPENPAKPKQLMILWSTKQERRIRCNSLDIKLDHSLEKESNWKVMDGAVAAWYFDGKEMHHDHLLEQCNLNLDDSVVTKEPKTSFTGKLDNYNVKIGKDMDFRAQLKEKNDFTMPEYHENEYLKGKYNYKILRMNKMSLGGRVDGKAISGSAYFQRVFVNSPAVPWHWGVFHFPKGEILTYYRPHVMGIPVKKDIAFWDGKELHEFRDIKVRAVGAETPVFFVSGKNETKKIQFGVHTYSHSSWTFRKPLQKLVYNEYPALLKGLVLEDKTGKNLLKRNVGEGVGNAEHTTGLLF
ncbi:MAG: hypothetical protein ABIG20_05210 [archaeon]